MDEIEVAREWVREAGRRVLFLLGAGASAPELPVSAQLTALVLDDLDRRMKDFSDTSDVPSLWRDIRPTLHTIGPGIEEVYEAVQTHTYQDSDPTRHWITSFVRFDSYRGGPTDLGRDAELILHLIRQTALECLDRGQKDASLVRFRPMLQAPKIGIVTLNYDLLVESAGAHFGMHVTTGAERWAGGLRWDFEKDKVPLLKVHGSMNWRGSRVLEMSEENLVPAMGLYEVSGLNESAPNNLLSPTVIFGSGSKLDPHSAFPALMRQFHDWLDDSDLLVVVGYSFRDRHIDESIRRWASLKSVRRMVIIDPFPRRDLPLTDGIWSGLLWAMDPDYRPRGWDVPSASAESESRRMVFLTRGSAQDLPDLLE